MSFKTGTYRNLVSTSGQNWKSLEIGKCCKIDTKLHNKYRSETCQMFTLPGGMVKQYSCTVIILFQWIPFPLVLCHSLKFSFVEGLCVLNPWTRAVSYPGTPHLGGILHSLFCLQPKWLQLVLQPRLVALPLHSSSWIKASCTQVTDAISCSAKGHISGTRKSR